MQNNNTMRPFFIISNYAKVLQNLPRLYKQSKNINKLCKFWIKSKKIALKVPTIFKKLCTMHKTAGTDHRWML